MKRIYNLSILVVALMLFSITTIAQSPAKMSYQAVIRNDNDVLVKSKQVGIQITIQEGTTDVYVETHNVATNANGLVTLVIGNGNPVMGSMNDVEWGNGAHFIKTETDPNGGTNYTISGTSQLLSVPYALFSGATKGPTDTDWELNSPNIYRNSHVGINTTSTAFALNVRDTLTGTNDIGSVIKVQGGSTSGGTYISLVGEIIGTNGSNRGVYGWSHGTSAGQNVGTYGQSDGSSIFNVGNLGHSSGIAPEAAGVYGFTDATGGDNYGVLGNASGAGTRNYGLIGYAAGAGTDYGVYGWTDNTGTNYAGYFEGKVTVTSDFRSTKTLTGSNDYAAISKATAGSTSNATYTGFIGEVEGANTSASNRGVYGWSHGANSVGQNVGVYGQGNNSTVFNVGALGHTSGTATEAAGLYGFSDATGSYNYGVSGNASGVSAGENYGLVGYAAGSSTKNYGVYGWTGPSSGPGVSGDFYAGYFQGDVTITGNLNVVGAISKGSGTFKIDHPLDPENKYLVHSFVESPDMMNIYNGNVTTGANGYVTVEMPEYFEAANKEFRYQLTVIGTFAQAIIKEKMAGNKFVIQTNQPNIEVSWQVTGVRADKYANDNRVVVEEEKSAKNKGTYLHPEVYGASEDRSESAKHKMKAPKNLENSTPNTVDSEDTKSTDHKMKVPQSPSGASKVNTVSEEKK